jgi:hypothetical protein
MDTTSFERPDLSALSRERRINVLAACTQGAAWKHQGGVCWLLRGGADEPRGWAAFYTDDNDFREYNLPRYTTDPAAWGALLEKERIGVQSTDGGMWIASWHAFDGLYATGGWSNLCSSPGEAVALAVLAKYKIPAPQ